MQSERALVLRGPCAKRRVICWIFTADHQWFRGENDCANPQAVCPRAPGEDYAKCNSVCGQVGHAEIQAINAAEVAGAPLAGASARILGHYYICEPCGAALRDAGISDVTLRLAP